VGRLLQEKSLLVRGRVIRKSSQPPRHHRSCFGIPTLCIISGGGFGRFFRRRRLGTGGCLVSVFRSGAIPAQYPSRPGLSRMLANASGQRFAVKPMKRLAGSDEVQRRHPERTLVFSRWRKAGKVWENFSGNAFPHPSSPSSRLGSMVAENCCCSISEETKFSVCCPCRKTNVR